LCLFVLIVLAPPPSFSKANVTGPHIVSAHYLPGEGGVGLNVKGIPDPAQLISYPERKSCSEAAMSEIENIYLDGSDVRPSFDNVCNDTQRFNPNFSKVHPYQDKAKVKQIVQEWAPDLRIAETIAVVRDSNQITAAMVKKLPQQYVVKGTHGSSMTIIVRDDQAKCLVNDLARIKGYCVTGKEVFANRRGHWKMIKKNCAKWLSVDFGKDTRQPSYSVLKPGCIFEASLAGSTGGVPPDLKVFTFHGKPFMLLHVNERFGKYTSELVTPTLKRLPAASGLNQKLFAKRCEMYDEPVDLNLSASTIHRALKYAEDFAGIVGVPALRVDFFVNSTDMIFAELTFTSFSCNTFFFPPQMDALLGQVQLHKDTNISADCLRNRLKARCDWGIETMRIKTERRRKQNEAGIAPLPNPFSGFVFTGNKKRLKNYKFGKAPPFRKKEVARDLGTSRIPSGVEANTRSHSASLERVLSRFFYVVQSNVVKNESLSSSSNNHLDLDLVQRIYSGKSHCIVHNKTRWCRKDGNHTKG
jgi:hypothetical protein